jgi:hypothetical protein
MVSVADSATSSDAIGWISAVGSRMTSPSAHDLIIPGRNSKKLRRVDDGVRNPRFTDQLFLADLRPEVATGCKLLRAHDGKRDMVAHAGSLFGAQQVSAGPLKEVHGCGIVERRRVGQVHHHASELPRFLQALHDPHRRGCFSKATGDRIAQGSMDTCKPEGPACRSNAIGDTPPMVPRWRLGL